MGGGSVAIDYTKASTTKPGEGRQPDNKAEEWEVSAETAIRFWRVLFGFFEAICNGACRFFEIPLIPKTVFEVDQGQEYVIKTNFRGFTTQILRKVFMAKTPEHADRIVAGLSGVLTFGLMIGRVVLHFATHLPKSPKIKAWKAKRAEVEAQKKVAAALKDTGGAAAPLAPVSRPEPGAGYVPPTPAGS